MNENVRVLTYENPYTFHMKKEFKQYIQSPHICATRSLADGVEKKTGFRNVISMGNLIDLIYPEWNITEHRFVQYSQLSDILRLWNNLKHSEIVQSFKRNKLNLLITMRNLTEIGLVPNDLRQNITKIEENLFCDIWEKMLPYFNSYMNNALENFKDIHQVRKLFVNAGIPIVNDTVILHGFYYISPVQHYVFTKWKQLGLKLVFLNLYHSDFPSIFSFLEENFSEKYGWSNRENWLITKDQLHMNSHRFAANFEEEINVFEPLSNIKEKSYDYMIEFIEDIKKRNHYVSPNNEELKERLKEYMPESFLEERHFLSYPIGQYLFHLHSIWKEEKGNYFLNDKIIMECFSSGWLQVDGENARNYTEQLKAILPYFSNCETVDEWILQFEKLINAKTSSVQPLKKYNLKQTDYLEAVRINPVLRFSYFSVPLSKLKKIQRFLLKLVENTKWLVNVEEKRVTIKTHFNRIQQLLNDSNLKSSLADAVERKLVNQLESMLTLPIDDNQSYHVGDLSDAIIVYLKNGLKNSEDETDMVEQDITIYKMEDLDGIILRNEVNQLKLCAMDEKHFPNSITPVPWPLSLELISRLNNRSTDMYLFRKEHSLAFSKYLLFVALCFRGPISFSWVKNWNEYENLDKSIYIQLLNIIPENSSEDRKYLYIEKNNNDKDMTETSVILNQLSELPSEEFIEMNLCKRRFFYSTVVDKFSIYKNSFHQGFLIGNLVKIYAAIGKSKTDIIEMLENIFPFLSDTRLRSIVDQNLNGNYVSSMRKYGLGKRRSYKGIDYTESTLYFQFLTHKGAFQNDKWKSSFEPIQGKRKQKLDLIQQIVSDQNILTEANPSELCKLCPHAEYCEDAYFAVDISNRGFDDSDNSEATGA